MRRCMNKGSLFRCLFGLHTSTWAHLEVFYTKLNYYQNMMGRTLLHGAHDFYGQEKISRAQKSGQRSETILLDVVLVRIRGGSNPQ